MAVVVFVAPLASVAREMDIYFGSGNFAHLQHEFVMKEALDLSRRAGDITSVTGYAGGKQVGELDRICYSGLGGSPDYASLGHAQVVRLTLPDSSIQDFAQLYFTEVPKRKTFEVGAQFRSLIGLRGGMKSPFFPLIEKANGEGLKLLPGEGNDPDTAGKDVVYVYDTKKFPFRPAELANQFANNPPEVFTNDYRALNDVLRKIGAIFTTGCPEVRL